MATTDARRELADRPALSADPPAGGCGLAASQSAFRRAKGHAFRCRGWVR